MKRPPRQRSPLGQRSGEDIYKQLQARWCEPIALGLAIEWNGNSYRAVKSGTWDRTYGRSDREEW